METKESKIHELQLEKAKMRMTYDELRGQIEMLKDIEAKYKQMRVFSPDRGHKSVLIQTEEQDTSREPLLPNHHLLPRHLNFTSGENSSHDFSILFNNSTDNLIPNESEVLNLQSDDVGTASQSQSIDTEATSNDNADKKKTKKKRFRLFKLMQCISGKTQE